MIVLGADAHDLEAWEEAPSPFWFCLQAHCLQAWVFDTDEYSRAGRRHTSSFQPILLCLFCHGSSAMAEKTGFCWSNRQGNRAALDGILEVPTFFPGVFPAKQTTNSCMKKLKKYFEMHWRLRKTLASR